MRGHDGYVCQVIRNLLSNAVKYGGPTANVEIVAEGGPGRRDRPRPRRRPGFDGEAADRLFDLYYRAPGAATRAPGRRDRPVRLPADRGRSRWDDLGAARPTGGAEFGFQLPIYEADDDSPSTSGAAELAAAS